MTFLLKISLMISVLSKGSGQNTRKNANLSCENELDILTKDLEDLTNDWCQIKNQIYGESSTQVKFNIYLFTYLFSVYVIPSNFVLVMLWLIVGWKKSKNSWSWCCTVNYQPTAYT